MATVHITLSQAETRALTRGTLQILDAAETSADTITSSAMSQQSSITATNATYVWSITADGGAVYLKFGSNPTAASDDGWYLMDGERLYLGADVSQKVAVIDA